MVRFSTCEGKCILYVYDFPLAVIDNEQIKLSAYSVDDAYISITKDFIKKMTGTEYSDVELRTLYTNQKE